MINIGLIGCGNWAQVVIKEIIKHQNFNLKSIVCRKNQFLIENIKIHKNIDDIINDHSNDCIFVAADPKTNLEVVHLAKKNKVPLILEKPLSNTFIKSQEIENIVIKNNLIVYPNLTNYFSGTFQRLKKVIDKNINNIKKIIIVEGNMGPFRKNINPIWDWGYHSISLLYLLFENKEFYDVKSTEIKLNNKLGKGIVTKFNFVIDKKIDVKVLTGNLFKKKIRKIKIILKNNDIIENDLILHKIFFNKLNIFSNYETPIFSLLNNFNKSIKKNDFQTSRKIINASSKTEKFLDKFYKC